MKLFCYSDENVIRTFNNNEQAAAYFNTSKEDIDNAIFHNKYGQLYRGRFRFDYGVETRTMVQHNGMYMMMPVQAR